MPRIKQSAAELALLKAITPHGNTKPRPEPPYIDYTVLFDSLRRPTPFGIDKLCEHLALSRKEAKSIFGKALEAPNFPGSTIDTFDDANRGLPLSFEPWLDYLYPLKDACEIFIKTTGHAARAFRHAVAMGEIPHYRFNRNIIRLRRKEIEEFCRTTKPSYRLYKLYKGIL